VRLGALFRRDVGEVLHLSKAIGEGEEEEEREEKKEEGEGRRLHPRL